MTGPALEGEVATGGRVFAAGWCHRCAAPYVAVSLTDANGACSARCTKALRQLDPGTSRGRARMRRREQRAAVRRQEAAERQREWVAAHIGQKCPRCGKDIHTERTAAKAIAALARTGRGRAGTYPCPGGYGLHLENLVKRNARKKARRKAAERKEVPAP